MGSMELKSLKDTAPVCDINITVPSEDYLIVKNIQDGRYYISITNEWKLVQF